MQAEVLLRGATVYTHDRRQPRARSVAIGGGRVLALGQTDADLEDLRGAQTRVVELTWCGGGAGLRRRACALRPLRAGTPAGGP